MVLYLLPKGKQFITWVGGVCNNAAGLLLDTVSIHWVHVCERFSHNPLCCSHCPSQVLSVLFRAAAILYWHTETEDAFCCGPAEVCSRLKGSPSHLWLLRKSSLCWTFFTRWHVFKLWCECPRTYGCLSILPPPCVQGGEHVMCCRPLAVTPQWASWSCWCSGPGCLDILSVMSLIIIWYETQYDGVVCKTHKVICRVGSSVVNSAKRSGLSAQLCCAPVIRASVDDVLSSILTTWGLLVRKSLIQQHSE